MKRRSRAGGEPIKGQRRKTAELERRNAPKAVARSNSSPTAEVTEVTRLTRELNEALERQAATSEVLQVISSSPGDLQPVFAAMLENAVRICDAKFGEIYRWENDALSIVATHNTPPAFAEERKLSPYLRPPPTTPIGRMLATKSVIHVADLSAEAAYIEQSTPALVSAVELGGTRTLLAVPMLKEHELIGAFFLSRQEVRPFTEKQLALVQNFAAQAVIAIENPRLLNELRQRTTDLTERTAELAEALEQQTGTSEVLQVVSSSPSDLQPVFAAMLENAVRICGATFGNIFRWDGEAFHLVAAHKTPPAFAKARKASPLHPVATSHFGRLVKTKSVVHTPDLSAERQYVEERRPAYVEAVELGGIKTFLAVPMLKDDELIGAFGLFRQEVRPFTVKQIALVENFAAQAVIAIENARLLNELRQSLERQTATSEVLQVISSSPGDLQPVFTTMLEKAVRISDAKFGTLYLYAERGLRLIAAHDVPAAFEEVRGGGPIPPAPGGLFDEVIKTGTTVHLSDMAATTPYAEGHPRVVEAVELGGIRTVVAVPMLKENELIGIISIHRREVRPFTDKQIALVTNFAAQAIIAIENARLLNELRQSLEQQTATSEVLQVISRSPSDLEPVFASMLANAVRICDAKFGSIYRWTDGALHLVATRNAPAGYAEARRRLAISVPQGDPMDRALTTKSIVHIADLAAEPSNPQVALPVEQGGVRTCLLVPMLLENEPIGVFTLFRQEVRPFTDKEVALVANFAAQAVIAIENARLLRELREKTEQLAGQSQELAKLNQQLELRVADQVGEIERMGRLRRFLPPQVADLIVASGSEKQLESHRREITALFCDLRGFTGFTESADAEDVMALLRDYHAAIGEIIIKYNGTLERYAGDGVMVVFNDPVPVENPALQAVLMALELRDALGALTATWSRLGHEIGFGIGIAHGFATLGTIGFEGRFDYAAIGTVSNVASRLCDEAEPGQILISPRVLMKVENAVTVEPVGEFELKGIRRPLAAYNVLAASRANGD
jgi:GAF domain-containing protein